MSEPHRLRSPHVIVLTVALGALTLACVGGYGAAPHEDPPEDRIARDVVIGLWEDDTGRTVEFLDDGTFTATGATYGPAFGDDIPGGELTGTWDLCDDYRFEAYDEGAELGQPCDETGVGEWIDMDTDDPFTEELIFTGSGDDVRLYPWNIDVAPELDQSYAKVA
jgi:hypothetical protein